jgi:hypothetical protein
MSRYDTNEPHWNEDDWQARMGIDNPFPIEDEPSEDMDGDHESALASAGFGTDEDYGSFGGEDDWLDGSYEDA